MSAMQTPHTWRGYVL